MISDVAGGSVAAETGINRSMRIMNRLKLALHVIEAWLARCGCKLLHEAHLVVEVMVAGASHGVLQGVPDDVGHGRRSTRL